ncbi:MAG: class I SAM-dependent methyltransferase [Gemmatimonadaceae bacterium]
MINEASWQHRVTAALAAAYLQDDDPRWQSGFDGDSGLWREARELILDVVDRDGSFLDVGCATGHLIECLAAWSRARGRHLLLYGLELNRDLLLAAQRRLPDMADRIFEGNAVDWAPSHGFTFVRTGLEYVPPSRESFLVTRLLRDLVEPGGRLIIGPVSDPDPALAAVATAGVEAAATHVAVDRNGKRRYILSVNHFA